jgi:tetratricopeptide (TPR) repeat protein
VKVLDFGLARLLDRMEDDTTDFGQGGDAPELEDVRHTVLGTPDDDRATRLPAASSQGLSVADSREVLTVAGTFLGSPIYASPEQCSRFKVGPPSDIFSLGVVAWELLLGDHPFQGTGNERMKAVMAGKRKSLSGRKLHPRLAGLLRAMLALDPQDRPTASRVVEVLTRQLKPIPFGAWVSGGAAAVVLALGLGYTLLGKGVVADLVKDRPPRVAVLPFRNATGDASLGPLAEVGMTELMATALQGSHKLAVIDGETLNRAFATLRMDPAKALDPASRDRVLKALGAPLALQGTLERDGASGALRLTYALVGLAGKDRHHGQVILPAAGGAAAYALVDRAASELLHRVDPLGKVPPRGITPPPEAFSAYAQGKARFLKGDFQGSEPFLREASLKAPGFSPAVAGYASALRRLGSEQALPVTNWAVMAAKASGDRWSELRALGVKAYLARDRGDLEEAESLRRATLALAESLDDLDGAAVATNHLGLLAEERGRDAEASALYLQSLDLASRVGEKTYTALALNNLANLAMKRGDLEVAQGRYQAVLETQRAIGNRFGESLALNNLAVVALTRGNLDQASDCLAKSMDIRVDLGDKAGIATSLRNYGTLHLMGGQLDQAQAEWEQAVAAAQEAGVKTILAECRFCLGEIHRLRQRYRPAAEEYRQAVELLASGATPQVRIAAQAALAECEARQGRAREARARLEALDPSALESPYVHRAWAWVHHSAGEREKALESLERAKADPRHMAPEIRKELDEAAEKMRRG